jgi:hypothetical protein
LIDSQQLPRQEYPGKEAAQRIDTLTESNQNGDCDCHDADTE